MNKQVKRFFKDEDGAITVDWVVLTAAVCGLAAAAAVEISTGSNDLTADTSDYLTDQDLSGFESIQDVYGSTGGS